MKSILVSLLDILLAGYVIVRFFQSDSPFHWVFVVVAVLVLGKGVRRMWNEAQGT